MADRAEPLIDVKFKRGGKEKEKFNFMLRDDFFFYLFKKTL